MLSMNTFLIYCSFQDFILFSFLIFLCFSVCVFLCMLPILELNVASECCIVCCYFCPWPEMNFESHCLGAGFAWFWNQMTLINWVACLDKQEYPLHNLNCVSFWIEQTCSHITHACIQLVFIEMFCCPTDMILDSMINVCIEFVNRSSTQILKVKCRWNMLKEFWELTSQQNEWRLSNVFLVHFDSMKHGLLWSSLQRTNDSE